MKKLTHPFYMAFTKLIETAVSKKVLIFIVSTYLVTKGYLSGIEWVGLAVTILGVQGYLDTKKEPRKFHVDDDESPTMPGISKNKDLTV